MDLFYGIAEGVAATGQPVLEFRRDFPDTIRDLFAQSNALHDEITRSDRYKTAKRKAKERSQEKAKLGDETKTTQPRRDHQGR